MRLRLSLTLTAVLIGILCPAGPRPRAIEAQNKAGRSVAITFDDLPLNGPDIPFHEMQEMTNALVERLVANRIPAIGFVNEVQLYDEASEASARVALLRTWVRAGLELGNHTYSHRSLADISPTAFEEDIIRGEVVTKSLLDEVHQKLRYFRYPYLYTGKTPEDRNEVESFLLSHGYMVAPVTVDTLDWLFNYVYTTAKLAKDAALAQRTAEEYLAFTERRFEYYEMVSDLMAGRQIKQILLLHSHSLNADYLDRVVEILARRGYRFITLDEALTDSTYRVADTSTQAQRAPTMGYTDDSSLLHWPANVAQLPAPPDPSRAVYSAYTRYVNAR